MYPEAHGDASGKRGWRISGWHRGQMTRVRSAFPHVLPGSSFRQHRIHPAP
jgi:hypothetical protein